MLKETITDVYLNAPDPDNPDDKYEAHYQYSGFSVVPRPGEYMRVLAMDDETPADFSGIVETVSYDWEYRYKSQAMFVTIRLRGKVGEHNKREPND